MLSEIWYVKDLPEGKTVSKEDLGETNEVNIKKTINKGSCVTT